MATAEREYGRLQSFSARNFVAGQAVDRPHDAIKTADAQISAQRAAVATAERRAQTRRATTWS